MSQIEVTAPEQSATRAKPRRSSRRRSYQRFMKITRRIHMYLGLLLVPWVLLFGVSGFLFNHNSTFWGGNEERLASFDADAVRQATGYTPLDLDAATQQLLERLNAISSGKGKTFQLDASPWLSGDLRLEGRHGRQSLSFQLDLASGDAYLAGSERASNSVERAPFDGTKVPLDAVDTVTIAAKATTLLAASGHPSDRPLELPARGGNAEIRFRLTDESGRPWNGSYNIATGTLAGRAADEGLGMNFRNTVTRLHKTHNYPDQFGLRWLWNLAGDITALSLVLWGVTGLVMWWQIQPSRVLGAVAIFAAAIAALFVFSGTLADSAHNPPQIRTRG